MQIHKDAASLAVIKEQNSQSWRNALPFLAGLALFSDSIYWGLHNVSLPLLLILGTAYVVFIYWKFSGFRYHGSALLWLIVICLLHLVNHYTVNIHVASLSLLIFFYYALAAFFIDSSEWQKLQLPLLLALLLLPLFGYLEIYIGFPLRLMSTHIASDILSSFEFPIYSDSDLLYLDNQYMQVDVDCSGIKGLRSGIIFFTVLSWIYRRRLNLQWSVSLALFIAGLVTFNAMRITGMAWVEFIQSNKELAQAIHQSLGLSTFVLACLFGWALILLPQWDWQTRVRRYFPQLPLGPVMSNRLLYSASAKMRRTLPALNFVNKDVLSLFLLLLAVFIILPNPSNEAESTSPAAPSLTFPTTWTVAPTSLNTQEQLFFTGKQASAIKLLLQSDELQGSLILVTSADWKTQHNPLHCLQAQGFGVLRQQSTKIVNDKRVRLLNLSWNNQEYSAVYWWQNSQLHTEDYGRRVFASITQPHQIWTMVSVVVKNKITNNQLSNLIDIIEPQIERYYRSAHEN